MGQEKNLSSLDKCARLVTKKSNTNIIKSIMEKNMFLFVGKCLNRRACHTFNEYFEFNKHRKSIRKMMFY